MAARISKELKDLLAKESWDIEAKDIYRWDVVFRGPEACRSPYEDGRWLVEISFPPDYPWKAPKVKFITKIFHPNISASGEVCDKSFSENWTAKNTVASSIFPFIETLLLEPDHSNPINSKAAELLLKDPDAFHHEAALWTKKYA